MGPFALIHALDRVKIARRLSRDAIADGQVLDVLLEVNISGEASKHGFSPDELRAAAATLGALPGLRGHVGVDLVVAPDRCVVIEVNPRLTTSYVGLRRALRANLAELVWRAVVEGRLPRRLGTRGPAPITWRRRDD